MLMCLCRSGLAKGIENVGEIAEEDVNIMMTTNVIGLIGVRPSSLFRHHLLTHPPA